MRHLLGSSLWDLYSYVYDPITKAILKKQRQAYINLLLKNPGAKKIDKLLVVGVGTGLDLSFIEDGIDIEAIDYSDKMLERARANNKDRPISFSKMNAESLSFETASFDAVLLPLILAVAKDPLSCFMEAYRVLKPGSRMLIYDKFRDKNSDIGLFRSICNIFTNAIATSINLDFYTLLEKTDLKIIKESRSFIIFKTFLLEKPM